MGSDALKPSDRPDDADLASQLVTFGLGGQSYGLDITSVREIRSWTAPVELPGGRVGTRGVLDIRGSVVEVFDLSTILGRAPIEAGPTQVVLVVSAESGDFAVIADSVSDIVTVRSSEIREPPRSPADSERAKVRGLIRQGEQVIAVLDPAALLIDGAGAHWLD